MEPPGCLSAPLTSAGQPPAEWSGLKYGFELAQPPCPGFRPDEWVETLANARRFVDDFGAQADQLGWDAVTLFGVHPTSGIRRGDWCGVLMPCAYPVRELTAEFLRVHLWRCQRNKPRHRGVAVWEFGRG